MLLRDTRRFILVGRHGHQYQPVKTEELDLRNHSSGDPRTWLTAPQIIELLEKANAGLGGEYLYYPAFCTANKANNENVPDDLNLFVIDGDVKLPDAADTYTVLDSAYDTLKLGTGIKSVHGRGMHLLGQLDEPQLAKDTKFWLGKPQQDEDGANITDEKGRLKRNAVDLLTGVAYVRMHPERLYDYLDAELPVVSKDALGAWQAEWRNNAEVRSVSSGERGTWAPEFDESGTANAVKAVQYISKTWPNLKHDLKPNSAGWYRFNSGVGISCHEGGAGERALGFAAPNGHTFVVSCYSRDCDSERLAEMRQAIIDGAGIELVERPNSEPVDLTEMFPNSRPVERRTPVGRGEIELQCTVLQDAVRLLEHGQAELLAVKHTGGIYELLWSNEFGIWLAEESKIADLMRRANEAWRNEATRQVANSGRNDISKQMADIAEWSVEVNKPPHRVNVLKNIGMAIEYCRAEGIDLSDLTTCSDSELNNNKRYIGTQNGVVDLHTKQLLELAAARACLVTRQTPTGYYPEARHPIVDNLTAHLDSEVAGYVDLGLGYAMHGEPNRQYFQLLGEAGGAKTTILNAAYHALGDHRENGYGMALASNAVADSGKKDDASHSAMLIGIDVARIAVISELPEKLSGPRLKLMTGGDIITLREVYKRTGRAVTPAATVFIACNPPDKHKIDITDPALAERARVVPYPAIPRADRKTSVLVAVKTNNAVKAAMLAKLVAAAAITKDLEAAPEPPEAVKAATRKLLHEQLGVVGQWAAEYLAWDELGGKYGMTSNEILEWFEACEPDLVTDAIDADGDVRRANINGVYAEVKLYAGYEAYDFINELKRLGMLPKKLDRFKANGELRKCYRGVSKIAPVADAGEPEFDPDNWQVSV